MSVPAQSMSETLSTAWKWWTSELASLVPGRGPGAARKLPPGIVLSAEASGLRLIDERARGSSRSAAEHSGKDVWDRLVELARQRSVPIRLRLPYSACFVRRIELPAAVRHDAGRFLDLDLERATPFRLKDVYTAHVVDETRARRDTLGITQLVIRRDGVDPMLSDIQASGVRLTGIDCWNQEGTAPLPVDFLPRAMPADARGGGSSRHIKLLSIAAMALAASALYLGLSRHQDALAELTRQTADARTKAQTLRQRIDTSQETLKEIRAIQRMKSARTPAVEILENITRLLPDSAWLTDLRIDDDKIEFNGEAASAAPLVAAFENSQMFATRPSPPR